MIIIKIIITIIRIILIRRIIITIKRRIRIIII